ncbi:hypothetical protein GMMP1_960024 [Candidatus Magnetomoraceae bacterium gMMP-1]
MKDAKISIHKLEGNQMTKKKTNTISKTRKKNPVGPTLKKKKTLEKKTGPRHIPVVGIGASAGGLDAFKNLFESMPSDTGMAFVLIQHLDPTHESLMVDLLSRHTKMKVVQVENRMQLKANHVFMIPPNREIAIHNGELYLTEPTQRRGLQMPIDIFFRSLAED